MSAAQILFVVLVISGSLLVVNELMVYEKYDYNIDVIYSHLTLALDTHDITSKVYYINTTLVMLEPYHGNSGWWFPKENTNIDKTKELLKTVAFDIYEQNEIKDKDGYFTLPHNELNIYLNEEIKESRTRINDYGYSLHMNIENNPFLYILAPTIIFSFFGMLITTRWD